MTDVVSEYLREVELRVTGLPLLQRRELLADLEAHIAAARQERGAHSEAELIEILQRLGTPEAVAAAAHEEAGPPLRVPGLSPTPVNRRWPRWLIALIVASAVLIVIGFVGAMIGVRDSGPIPPRPAPVSSR